MIRQELVDLVNGDGVPVQTGIPREEAEKINGSELHIPVIGCVVLNSLGNVLVHKRPQGKSFAGCLDHVYGAITSGESPEYAAERECSEEVGTKAVKIQRLKEGVNINDYYQYSFVVIVEDKLDEINREVSWAKFFPAATLRTDNETGKCKFTPNFFIDLDAALASLEIS